ncbi:signal recognition particle protein Srp54 [Candidatus Aciduliprofundum boonei]|uniref:Signal recognition particle 54 kDa protein n=1 Tax=Aciduliprofundum boonei (strain DSM 19572 / T469) TaxID=439481 RepID=D3T9E7_ACIB4|nr:signal recognition particle protein Srp54 [Candidatus Aciduliprofundum boonei]ADD08726.1 GTP-binding signal recognition particle SRP54 G- domain protein [Aciduliprofundum boonei T469]HII55563.1 signal recognition particle protein [Candidatus Aciduliprofundum boonei]
MLDSLGESLRNTIRKISKAGYVDESLIKEVVRDIQRALLRADVEVHLALKLSKNVERRALEEKPPSGMSHRDFLIKIIYEELVAILGKEKEVALKPQKLMLVGLYGQGKTTTAGKLARYFHKKGLSVALIACDVHRPAAYEQLKQIGEQLNVPVFGIPGEKDARKIAREAVKKMKDYQVQIFDTSGRHALEDDLIEEIKDLKEIIQPDEIFLVLDATIGQQAGKQAKAFHDAVGVTGVIITKMDGSAKGGGALSAVAATGAPVVFIGTGEHLEDLEHFNPTRFISRLLGMGDLETLLETAKELELKEEEAEKVMERMMSGKFNLKDMYEIWEQMAKPGLLQKILYSLPFFKMGDIDKGMVEESEEKLRKYRIIMDSMTYEELENPEIIKSSRIKRIARGSGRSEQEVRSLLKEYNRMKKTMKQMRGNRKLMRALRKQLKSGDFDMSGFT